MKNMRTMMTVTTVALGLGGIGTSIGTALTGYLAGDAQADVTELQASLQHLQKLIEDNEEDLQKLLDGIELEDGAIRVDAISYADKDTDHTQVGVEIHSGRNRIVRRMFEAIGYHVVRLDRTQFAGLTKKNLKRGDWRFLTEREVNTLRMGSYE